MGRPPKHACRFWMSGQPAGLCCSGTPGVSWIIAAALLCAARAAPPPSLFGDGAATTQLTRYPQTLGLNNSACAMCEEYGPCALCRHCVNPMRAAGKCLLCFQPVPGSEGKACLGAAGSMGSSCQECWALEDTWGAEQHAKLSARLAWRRPGSSIARHGAERMCEYLDEAPSDEVWREHYAHGSRPFVLRGGVSLFKGNPMAWANLSYLVERFGNETFHVRTTGTAAQELPDHRGRRLRATRGQEPYYRGEATAEGSGSVSSAAAAAAAAAADPLDALDALHMLGAPIMRQMYVNPLEMLSVREMVAQFRRTDAGRRALMLLQQALVLQIDETKPATRTGGAMSDDFEWPRFVTSSFNVSYVNAWFANFLDERPRQSGIHNDGEHNVLLQLAGTRKVVVYSALEAQRLYPQRWLTVMDAPPGQRRTPRQWSNERVEGEPCSHHSPVQLQDVDLEAFPEFRHATPMICKLNPGDVLFMPSRTFHDIFSFPDEHGVNLMVQTWFKPNLWDARQKLLSHVISMAYDRAVQMNSMDEGAAQLSEEVEAWNKRLVEADGRDPDRDASGDVSGEEEEDEREDEE